MSEYGSLTKNTESKTDGILDVPRINSARRSRGFTLIEVIVSIGIFVILLSVVLLKYGDFQGNVLLSNLVYQVALSVRQAQIYGIGVRASSGSFQTMYALHFDKAINNSYVFFAEDKNQSVAHGLFKYVEPVDPDSPLPTEDSIVDTYKLRPGYTLKRICATVNATYVCSDDVTPLAITTIDVYFKRPKPDAIIKVYDGAGTLIPNTGGSARLEIQARGRTRCVTIEKTGQISTTATCPQ